MQLELHSVERTRLACWRRRLADASEALGETPRAACGTQALLGGIRNRIFQSKAKQASRYQTQAE